jgi:Spy/CpxP family protein refolding chaperone
MDLADMFVFKAHFILANASDLGLSDDQMDKIMALKYGFKKSVIKNDADIESLVLDIKEELRKAEVDVAAVNTLIDKKYAAKAQRAKEIVSSCVSLKKVLTKEQMGKLKDLWQGGMMKKAKYPGIEKEGMEEPEKGG